MRFFRRRKHDDVNEDTGVESESSERAATAPPPDDPRKPDAPTDLKKPSWLYVVKKTGREFGADQCTDLAAALVYYSVLALFPALLAIVSLLGLFGQAQATEKAVFDIIGSTGGVRTTLQPVIASLTRSPAAPVTFVIGIVGALWSASGYVGAFGRAMNRVYGIDEGRPVWKLRPTQLLVTVVAVILVVVGALILVLSGPVAQHVGNAIGLGSTVVFVWGIVKWPILAIVAVVVVAVLYYFSPNVRQPKFKWVSTGSVLALLLWAIASAAFAFYVGNFGHYNSTYGSLGAVIVFLLWLWITNIALLFGAEWDAELERGRELQAGIAAEEDIQLPPRDTRQADKKAAKRADDIAQGRRLRESRGAKR